MDTVSQEFEQGMSGTICLYSTIHGASSGRTGMAGGDSDVWGLASSRGFFTHMSNVWAEMTCRLGSARTVY